MLFEHWQASIFQLVGFFFFLEGDIYQWRKPLDPYDFTVEVRNRFKGIDVIDRVPDELWMEVPDIVQETGINTIPKRTKCNKSKMAV